MIYFSLSFYNLLYWLSDIYSHGALLSQWQIGSHTLILNEIVKFDHLGHHWVPLSSLRQISMPMLSELLIVWLFNTEVIGLSHLVTCMVGCISCYTRAYSPFSVVKLINFSHSFYDLPCKYYNKNDYSKMAYQSKTFY